MSHLPLHTHGLPEGLSPIFISHNPKFEKRRKKKLLSGLVLLIRRENVLDQIYENLGLRYVVY